MQYALIPAAIIAAGWGVWVRRAVWRLPWERLLTLSLILQAIGFILIWPAQPQSHFGLVLLSITGIGHLRDFFGHLTFLAALSCLIYAVAHRLVPDDEIQKHMRRVEMPGGLAAFGMLTTLSVSKSIRASTTADFFNVPCDGWLVAYWSIYGSILVWLVGYVMWLLIILRQDSRSRAPADMFIAAAALGLVGVAVRAISMIDPNLHVPSRAIWTPLCCSCIASVGAATVSAWRKRRWLMPPKARIESKPEVIVMAPAPPATPTFG